MKSRFVNIDASSARATGKRTALAIATLGAAAGLAVDARAQLLFSIDYKGGTNSMSTVGGMIRESDVLRPFGGAPSFNPMGPPQIQFTGAQLGLPGYNNCTASSPGFPCHIEVDALSTGRDRPFILDPNPLNRPRLFFSVDIHSNGVSLGAGPNVFTEAAANDAAADLFTPFDLPPPPLNITGVPVPRNVLVIDGNGSPSGTGFTRRGLGLIEPHATPTPPAPPSPPFLIGGDDVDAIALHPMGVPMPFLFYSLDGGVNDPATGFPGSGSAQAAAVSIPLTGLAPGSIITVNTTGTPSPSIYGRPDQLGLDLFGPGTDDLDVLIISENGVPGYQKAQFDYAWLPGAPGGQKDMVVFSVRRGSALVVNQVPDSRFGIPIEEGDLLVPPYGTPLAPMPPAMWIAAENLGLRTRRTHGALPADDLDGGATGDLCYDCNGNGVEDAVDISTGSSVDTNGNGVPDECETSVTNLCDCPIGAPPPCGNAGAAGHGCGNSAFAGGALLTATGPSSVAFDALTLNASDMTGGIAIFFQGASTTSPTIIDDGIGCVGGPIIRLGNKPVSSNTSSYPQGGDPTVSVRGSIPAPGGTYHYQCFYRNAVAGFCPPATSNRTNAISIVWFP